MVIAAEEIKRVLPNITNLKHRAILTLALVTALRVSEVVNLKMADIDRHRMVLTVKNSKGFKDRQVPITESLLQLLTRYYHKYTPVEYLFNGATGGTYSATSCNALVKKHFGKKYHFHNLRHSAATIMHENGLDIATLSKILGHNQVKTTMIYTHISTSTVSNAARFMVNF
ncbi:MAG: tyrosine-type recombinase/integrase [Aureispira sp.]